MSYMGFFRTVGEVRIRMRLRLRSEISSKPGLLEMKSCRLGWTTFVLIPFP